MMVLGVAVAVLGIAVTYANGFGFTGTASVLGGLTFICYGAEDVIKGDPADAIAQVQAAYTQIKQSLPQAKTEAQTVIEQVEQILNDFKAKQATAA